MDFTLFVFPRGAGKAEAPPAAKARQLYPKAQQGGTRDAEVLRWPRVVCQPYQAAAGKHRRAERSPSPAEDTLCIRRAGARVSKPRTSLTKAHTVGEAEGATVPHRREMLATAWHTT